MLRSFGFLLLLPLLQASGLAAQDVPVPGDRVRVRQTNGVSVTGVLEVASTSGVQLRGEAEAPALLMIPARSVRTIEKSLGKERRFGMNFGLTVATTSVSMGIVGLLAQGCRTVEPTRAGQEPTTRCDFGDSKAEAALGGLGIGAALGAPIGLLIGLTARHERWTRAILPGTRAAIRPVIGPHLGVAVSW